MGQGRVGSLVDRTNPGRGRKAERLQLFVTHTHTHNKVWQYNPWVAQGKIAPLSGGHLRKIFVLSGDRGTARDPLIEAPKRGWRGTHRE